jgi:putative acetyltransferase
MVDIREATIRDQYLVREIYQSAFEEAERELVSELAVRLLFDETTISLVAEVKGVVAGHVAFSPVVVRGEEDTRSYLLAPLAVLPDFQRQGIGSRLVKYGKNKLEEMEVPILFVYGDPAFYGRFEFQSNPARKFLPPYPLQYPSGWQVCVSRECTVSETPREISCIASLRNPKLW